MLSDKCFLLCLENTPIYQQLLIEEALLRCDSRNVCLININPPPAVVLGISCDPEKDLFWDHVSKDNIPVIRRYSGGGTVYIDNNTIMVSWIISKDPNTILTPQSILAKSYHTYAPLFPSSFTILGNDYVLGHRKFGGNGQYMQKERFVHHTSFLWDMDLDKISCYLQQPSKQPDYRKNRTHKDFLTTLRPIFPRKEDFVNALKNHIELCTQTEILSKESISSVIETEHRVSTILLTNRY